MPQEQFDLDASASVDELDRRESDRKSCELESGEVSIRFGPGHRLVGEVLDESLKGIGVRMTDEVEAHIGQEVEAYYKSETRRAVVRWVRWDAAEQAWRLGLMFVDDE
ncbi:MAG: hypothetical protein V3R99_05975 [Thermoguttaceae bacterium]